MMRILRASMLTAAVACIALLLFAACQQTPPTPTTPPLPPTVALVATPVVATAASATPTAVPPATVPVPTPEATPTETPTPTPASPSGTTITSTHEIVSGRAPNASINGTVTYRENLDLTPGAVLVVELRDVSLQDAPSILIARQTISSPGQVPIEYEVRFNRDDINPRNTYGISARIIESDGRLAFINDTAHDVITRGNPDRVNMVLVLVEPPPDLIDESNPDWQKWVEVPVTVVSANLIPNEPDNYLRVNYYQSAIEGCARPGSQSFKMNGNDINVRVTLMQPPPTTWAIPCHEQVMETDAVLHLGDILEPGQTYRIIVNKRIVTAFSTPPPHLGYTNIAESQIESWDLESLETDPVQRQLRVVSGLPTGRGCTSFNGYELRRNNEGDLHVVITHHRIADLSIVCTTEHRSVETVIPLGSAFEAGLVYSISVNSEPARTFQGG